MRALVLTIAAALTAPACAAPAPDGFAPLAIYDGAWRITADHPWSGAAPGAIDHLVSACRRFTRYFACEQTVNGVAQVLIVYTLGGAPGRLNTRTIAPDGLAGGRGELLLQGDHWTYLDKPPAGLKGNWSRTENYILDRDHIRFEEYESPDEGKSWTRTNAGREERAS